MPSKIQRKNRRRAKLAGVWERHATRSKYAAKVWEREHGQAPNPLAEANARKKGKASR